MQNKIEINDDQLVVTPQGINKLTSLQDSITIPLSHVKNATIDDEVLNEYKGLENLVRQYLAIGQVRSLKRRKRLFLISKRRISRLLLT